MMGVLEPAEAGAPACYSLLLLLATCSLLLRAAEHVHTELQQQHRSQSRSRREVHRNSQARIAVFLKPPSPPPLLHPPFLLSFWVLIRPVFRTAVLG
ncbi:hypothetical protein F5X99DRAFT_374579 [Biscogniauxia marginata]|nr:hypothetical protein F5X99DRAFT_374579 [Biscogniauxia marginata]